jgi:hypothetical protein
MTQMKSAGLAVLLLSFAINSSGQKYEAGVHITGLHLHKIDEGPVGFGGRFHYNVTPFIAADLEVTHFPENSAGNFGQTTGLFGVRAGKRFEHIGLFVKGRPGFMHFGGRYFQSRLQERMHSIVDGGAVIEYYPTKRMFIRIDTGDTVIYFGSARLFSRVNPDALGTIHNFQSGLGIGLFF